MIERFFWNSKTRDYVLSAMRYLPINSRRIICICWGGDKYNCNPKAISDALINDERFSDFHVIYAFKTPQLFMNILPERIEAVQIGSFRYFYLLATSKFIVANTRFVGIMWPFPKKQGQKYIQTQHGGHGIKKVELDVRKTLSDEYIKCAIEDTKRTDLMLSDSKYWTNIYRTAYQYKGEVLERGLPRNDVFFSDKNTKLALKEKMLTFVKSQNSEIYFDDFTKFLIYTPTFRGDGRKDVYGFDVDKVVGALETRFGGIWYILVSSHPNMIDYYRDIYDFSKPRLIDVGEYSELQELLVVCDALITDYSSAEMDFSLTNKPVFQLIRDRESYDRETYIDPRSLPFPYAENDDELCDNIINFDQEKYKNDLELFNQNTIGLEETGRASTYVVDWMNRNL